jgi:hypothetical protein
MPPFGNERGRGRNGARTATSRETCMMTQQQILDFYTHPVGMTSAGALAPLFDALPSDVAALVRIIQGLGVYENVATSFYGFTIPDERKSETHLRPVEQMLERLLALNNQPLGVARPIEQRLVGRCHHFMLLLVAMLRAKGIPARGRCGLGSYFNPGFFEDHWVCEYWNTAAARWVLVDPQFDAVWREQLKIDHNILDVPRDRFLVAGEAWVQCRAGAADAGKFGIDFTGLRGLWFIAGNLVRDVAALNKVETLPWDVWGAQPRPNETLNDVQLAFFDTLAALTREPDAAFEELRRLYAGDERVRVPATVFNAVLNRAEAIVGV